VGCARGRNPSAALGPGALFALGDPAAYEVYFAVLTCRRKPGQGLVESQLEILRDPDALARIGFETGLGFVPFGSIARRGITDSRRAGEACP
jgi:hypothetical protein